MTLAAVVDLETTGLDVEKGHKIIEISILTYDIEKRELIETYVQRIDPQRPIDAKAQEIHGIAYTDLIGSPTWDLMFTEVLMRINRADIFIAHNADFDLPFIKAQLASKGIFINPEYLCTMSSGRWATFNGKFPKLSELCFALGVDYDPNSAHGAEYDTQITAECLFRGLDRGFYHLPESLLEKSHV